MLDEEKRGTRRKEWLGGRRDEESLGGFFMHVIKEAQENLFKQPYLLKRSFFKTNAYYIVRILLE